MSRNLLDQETSPYLLQHKDNPVHWRPWGDAALAEARTRNVPILLSIGYAACHWCHVMAHESFEDPDVAAVMNERFVNIKVDREERPDIDAIYMTALQMLGEPGGWPLTMFLAPDGEPFWGGTYFPKEPRHGRPGFIHILKRVSAVFNDDPVAIGKNRQALVEALQNQEQAASHPGTLTMDALDGLAFHMARQVDPIYGGLIGAPKFPQTGLLELLWRAALRTQETAFASAVDVSLSRMCQGGIYDHLGGGFARYAVDEQWLVPHFEKMLYDNAQLVRLMTLVWRKTREPLLAARIAETNGWVLREMVAENGGFASSLDADSEGEEGKFYVWNEAEIDAVLSGDEVQLFKVAYDVSAGGNWEGKTILNRQRVPKLGPEEDEARLAAARDKLLKARDKRIRPGWDDKVLTDWNGLMIGALAEAGAVFGKEDWIAAAARAFQAVIDTMTEGERLFHSWRLGQARHPAMADGYANMAEAALMLFQVTGEERYLHQARIWEQTLARHYAAPSGGYYYTADDAEALIVRTRSVMDNAQPSANGTMVGVLSDLFHLTGETVYRDKADALVKAFAGQVKSGGLGMGRYLNGFDSLLNTTQIAVIGEPGHPETKALTHAAWREPSPSRIVQVVAPDTALPPSHPAAGKTLADGKPTAYICRGTICSAPITEPDALQAKAGQAPN